MASLTGKSRDPRDGIQSSRRGDPHITPVCGPAGEMMKKKKKKKKKQKTTEEKTEPICEQKKRGHPSTSTPSCSDDSEKPQTQQQSTNTEKSSDLNHAKGRAKERSSVKSRKGKKHS